MILAIDFDGVIHDPNNREPGYRMGKPMPGAKAALEQLTRKGHRIIIHSVRAREDSGVRAIANWLNYFQFPYVDNITDVKPGADVYIDDKAIRFVDWPAALVDLGFDPPQVHCAECDSDITYSGKVQSRAGGSVFCSVNCRDEAESA